MNLFQPSRLPQLVEFNPHQVHDNNSKNLPVGWTVNKRNSGRGSRDDWKPIVDTLNGGSSTYAFFDLFRPISEYKEKDDNRCKTNFLVTIAYNQVRPNQSNASKGGDIVMQEYRGSAVWCSPISTDISFLPTTKKILPSGNRHPSNV